MLLQTLTVLSLLSIGQAAIIWGPCDDLPDNDGLLPIQCAKLQVPLDYADKSSNRSLALSLARIRAVNQPAKGSIQFNFGGPGQTSRDSLHATSPTLMGVTGGNYDLVAFDPRGTGSTIPFTCYDDFGLAEAAFKYGFSNESDVALGATWARGTLDSRVCLENEGDIGHLLGTAYVARDLISVVDALEEDGMLRFWGFSYGTNLGSTVAAMFPERVDKLILDGVQNPHEYWHALADFEEWTDSDKVLHGIFKTCFELPERCALHTNDTNADELEQKFWNLLDHIKYHPIVGASRIVDYNALKLVMASSLYTTVVWGILAHALQGLFDGVVNESMDLLLSVYWPSDLESVMDLMRDTMALQGIHCSDRYPRVDTFEEYLPAVQRLYNSSRIMGDSSLILNMACAQWPFHAKERYEGDFNVETANPILVIGNHFDSHTPLVSAYNISTSFVGSRVLEIAGYGHASLNVPSRCTVEKVSAYFNDGTLPEHGSVCVTSAPPYSGLWWPDVLADVAGNQTIHRRTGTRDGSRDVPVGFIPGRRVVFS